MEQKLKEMQSFLIWPSDEEKMFSTKLTETLEVLGPLLLTWIDFTPSMDN